VERRDVIGDDMTAGLNPSSPRPRRWGRRLGLAGLLVMGGLAACSDDDDAANTDPAGSGAGADPGDCVVVDMAVSSEKVTLLGTLADEFNASGAEVDGRCIFVRPRGVASGSAATLIPDGWPNPDANGPAPVIWSPAASGWAGIVNERAGGTSRSVSPIFASWPTTPTAGPRWATRSGARSASARPTPTTPPAG